MISAIQRLRFTAHDGNPKEEAELVLYVRKIVGDDMTCADRPVMRTFADALYVGRACDEARIYGMKTCSEIRCVCFCLATAARKAENPLLQTEHIRGVEPKADAAGGTDMLRSDQNMISA